MGIIDVIEVRKHIFYILEDMIISFTHGFTLYCLWYLLPNTGKLPYPENIHILENVLILSKLQYRSLYTFLKEIMIKFRSYQVKWLLVRTIPFSNVITPFNLQVIIFLCIYCTRYHMEYINTPKWRNKPFRITLQYINVSCGYIRVFGSCQVFYKRIYLWVKKSKYISCWG